jgi:hypothetical protein
MRLQLAPETPTHFKLILSAKADCDAHYYLLVAKVRARLAVSKQRTQRIHVERSHLKKLRELESKEQYCVEISNRFSALENLDPEVDNNRI